MKSRLRSNPRWIGGLAAILACAMTAGCIRNSVEIRLDRDGSGRILVTRVYPRETVDQMREQIRAMALHNPTMVSTNRDPFFDLKGIRRAAAQYGASVKFVNARKIDSHGARGYVALYTFKDINDVAVSLQAVSRDLSGQLHHNRYSEIEEEEPDDTVISSSSRDEGENFEFRFTPGPTNRLQVMCPSTLDEMPGRFGMMAGSTEEEKDDNAEESRDEQEDLMAAHRGELMQHLGGSSRYLAYAFAEQEDALSVGAKSAVLSISVEVSGTDIRSSASLPDPDRKSRFFLLNFDAEKLLATPAGKKLVTKSRYGFGNPEFMLAAAMQSGLSVMETNRHVTVEFK